MRDQALKASEVARILRIPVSTVFLLCRRGELRGFRAGRHLRIRHEWVEDFIRDHETARMEEAGGDREAPANK